MGFFFIHHFHIEYSKHAYKNIFISLFPFFIMINWILIIVALFILLAFFRVEHTGRRIKVIALILVLTLIYFSVSMVISQNKVDLKSPNGIFKGLYLYAGWLGEIALKMWDVGRQTVGMTANVIKGNSSSSSPNWKWEK